MRIHQIDPLARAILREPLTIRQAARLAMNSVMRMRSLVVTKRLPATKIDDKWYIEKADLDNYIKEHLT